MANLPVMTAANKAILASTTKKTVRALLYKRLSLVKFTAFGAFYNCIEQQYEKDHPGQIISFYHFHQIEENWKSLSDESKEKYRALMRLENALVDKEKQKIDNEIIALRPGERAYTGQTISRRVLQQHSSDLDQTSYNPVEHYHQDMVQQLIGTPWERSWVANYQAHLAEAYRSWYSLPQYRQDIYIHRAKIEYRNSNGRCSSGDEMVYEVLARALEKYRADASRIRLFSEYLSDDEDGDCEMDVQDH